MTRKNNRNRHGGKWKNSTHAAKHDKKNRTPKAQPIGAKTPAGGTVVGHGGTTTYSRAWCEHYQQPFDLGDGEVIYASAYQDSPHSYSNYGKVDEGFVPDVGFYLDSLWSRGPLVSPGSDYPRFVRSRTEIVMFPWADRQVPRDMEAFDRSVEWLFSKIRAGKLVDTGCFASHGRTGTLLACMLVKKGMSAPQAQAEVRGTHCVNSIEGLAQENWIRRYDTLINGRAHSPLVPNYQTGGTQERTDPYARAVADPVSNQSRESVAQYLQDVKKNEALTTTDAEDYSEWLRLNAQALDGLVEDGDDCLCYDKAYLCPVHDSQIRVSDGDMQGIIDQAARGWAKADDGSEWCYDCMDPKEYCDCRMGLEGCM